MDIPFSLPLIDEDVISEVNHTLTVTGWLTSGPKVKALEAELKKLTAAREVICVNSWVSGAMLMLRWFGVKQGDEVIIPAYTYSATALAVMNMGATPVMIDVKEDFNIDTDEISEKINEKTKLIIPVDLGGWPCDYDAIMKIVNEKDTKKKFKPTSEKQKQLGRILVLTDAAHSIGSNYQSKPAAIATDCAIFSFHSVKNITTGEGGAICLNLPQPFNIIDEFKYIKYLSLNGQTKSAFEKNQPGAWRYDIIDQGMKVNMPDICAAIGLSQIRKYQHQLLPERKKIYQYYQEQFQKYNWAILPPEDNNIKTSSYHLYLLRIKNISEEQRDKMIQLIGEKGVGVNVHYIPMPMLTLFRYRGYNIDDFPITYNNYKSEISLPLYNGLTIAQQEKVIDAVVQAYEQTIKI